MQGQKGFWHGTDRIPDKPATRDSVSGLVLDILIGEHNPWNIAESSVEEYQKVHQKNAQNFIDIELRNISQFQVGRWQAVREVMW